MSVFENVTMALSSLKAHKLRSMLTMLGIIIGVAAVIIVVAIGQGGEAMLKSEIVGPGNTVELFYQPSEEEMQSNPNIIYEAAFNQEDIRILENLNGVKRVAASSSEFTKVSHKQESIDSSVVGINDAFLDLNRLNVASGRNFTSADFLGGARVAIASHTMQEDLFDGKSPIGQVIRIGTQPVEIIGVMEKSTGLLAFDTVQLYMPSNAWKTVFSKNDVTSILLQAENTDQLNTIGKKASAKLNSIHNAGESYQVINMEEIASAIGQITRIMTLIIGSVAGISLVVGGIGVMNIMLVSVTERTKEIGIRLALGATRRQILTQFLIESIILTLIGGLLGIVLGWIVVTLISLFAGLPSLISWQVVLGGVAFSMTIGIVFGILPANKASKMNPIESLRYE
ncbi:ABC transporter permease [Peribacillus sp. NPDC097264]|uniref:ABC transporter permease n=1 Tax=Peribacillus sp. NPDC097264 TaxID=3390616 RepID=UPI003D060FF8